MVVLILLGACGAGWTRALLDKRASIETLVSMAPIVGAAVLIIGGLVADELGMRLTGLGGVLTYVIVSAGGLVAARRARHSSAKGL